MLLNNFLEKSAERLPDKEALICNDQRLTYREIDNYANCFGNALVAAGLQKLDRVAVYLENSVESVISIFGILKAGGIFVLINPQVKARKLEYILNDCQVKFLIAQVKLVVNYTGNYPNLNSLILTDEKPNWEGNHLEASSFWELIKHSPSKRPYNPCIDIDLCSLIYTSGSTGNPKGVMLTHSNMVAAANSISEYLENTREEIIINCLPLSFDYGLYNLLMPFKFGGTVVLEKAFNPFKVINLIKQEKISGLPLIPTTTAMLLKLKNLDNYDLTSLRYITSTGQVLPTKHIVRLSELFPKAKIYSMYGLTECKRVAYLPPEELLRRPTSVGKAMPNTEAYIVDEDGNRITQPGKIGELMVRGSNVMQGYWNLPEETAKVLQIGNYPGEKILRTRDLFKMDEENYLYFVARKDEMIKTRGERISPKEIENVLYELDDVIEAVVFGVEDEILGQAIKVSLVLEESSKLTEKDIIQYCFQRLEKSMIPKYINICHELPKTLTGKLSKPKYNVELITS